jgi:hypothetical protein
MVAGNPEVIYAYTRPMSVTPVTKRTIIVRIGLSGLLANAAGTIIPLRSGYRLPHLKVG